MTKKKTLAFDPGIVAVQERKKLESLGKVRNIRARVVSGKLSPHLLLFPRTEPDRS